MASGTTLRPRVQAARTRLAEGRQRLRERHAQGAPGVQICNAWADLLDSVVLELFESALVRLDQLGPKGMASQIALVPNGGYGRRDVAPYSDVDLMILYAPGARARVAPLAERLFRDLYDVQLKVGHSLRSPREAIRESRAEAKTFTSLVECRYLGGSVSLYTRFARMLEKYAQRRRRHLVDEVQGARLGERAEFGETVYLLEPNIKRSRGGLRELHLLRWLGFVRWGTPEPDGLQRCGALSPADKRAVHRTTEFLLRLRNEMHLHHGRTYDVLDRVEQVRLAEWLGYEQTEGMLPVERFMQEYFRLTDELAGIVTRLAAAARPRAGWSDRLAPLLGHQVEGDFLVGPTISATRSGREKLRSNLAEVLRLVDLANLYDKPISRITSQLVCQALPEMDAEMSPDVRRRFLSIMSQPARLGELLRLLHELGALEKIIPAFTHARCLLQFNEYHKYTVDEHCLRAVEWATDFVHDDGPLGRVYRAIAQKHVLHLALLIHDLGKGFAEDHSEVGLRIAAETAERLGMPEDEAEILKFLVHRHLLMSHLAFRRDTSSDRVVVDFAVECGSPEVLQMLYVLTAADFGAVGPGVWNHWKLEVLTELFLRAMDHLAGDSSAVRSQARIDELRQAVSVQFARDEDWQWYHAQIAALPRAYLSAAPPETIAAELRELRKLRPGEVMAHGRYHESSQTVEYTVGTYEQIAPGIFHRLAGALARRRLEVLSADIHTLADRLVLDRFRVHDPDFAGPPPPARLAEVERSLADALMNPDAAAPVFRQVWRMGDPAADATLPRLPNQVRIDNRSSETHTIIEVFAADRPGLLYTIARAIFEQQLSVSLAKIGTYLDQVLDAFYVTDHDGGKIRGEERLQSIRRALLAELDTSEREPADLTG